MFIVHFLLYSAGFIFFLGIAYTHLQAAENKRSRLLKPNDGVLVDYPFYDLFWLFLISGFFGGWLIFAFLGGEGAGLAIGALIIGAGLVAAAAYSYLLLRNKYVLVKENGDLKVSNVYGNRSSHKSSEVKSFVYSSLLAGSWMTLNNGSQYFISEHATGYSKLKSSMRKLKSLEGIEFIGKKKSIKEWSGGTLSVLRALIVLAFTVLVVGHLLLPFYFIDGSVVSHFSAIVSTWGDKGVMMFSGGSLLIALGLMFAYFKVEIASHYSTFKPLVGSVALLGLIGVPFIYSSVGVDHVVLSQEEIFFSGLFIVYFLIVLMLILRISLSNRNSRSKDK